MSKKINRRYLLIGVVIIIIIAIGFLVEFRKASKANYNNTNKNTSKHSSLAVAKPATKHSSNAETSNQVKVVLVGQQEHHELIITQGSLLAQQSVNLSSQQAGKITGVYFKEGQNIKKGQLLIQLDNSELSQQAKSKYAQLLDKQDMYNRVLEVFNKNKQYIAKSDLNKAKQDYLAAKAQYLAAKTAVEQTKITAPFDGKMGALESISVGSNVSVGQSLVQIINTSKIQVRYYLSQKYLNKLSLGQLVEVEINLESNQKIPAVINYISPQVDVNNNTFEVRALLDLSKVKLKVLSGMSVMLTQVLPKVQNVIMIPGIAIVTDSLGFHVYIVKENKQGQTIAEEVIVTVGQVQGDSIVITSGLKVGQKLIVAGQQDVGDGSHVQVS